jgi:uncharacterized membrane protein
VIDISQMQSQFEQLMPAAPSKKSSRKSILALSVFALGLNAAAAAYTMSPSDFALPDVHRLVAELLPHERAPVPMQDLVAAALSDIQSTQQDIVVALQDNGLSLHRNAALIEGGLQRNAALLQDNGTSLQQNTALLQQNATKLDILRQEDGAKLDILRSSLTDEHSDVKVISSQLSTLIAKVDSVQATTSEITSSISKERARTLFSGGARKWLAHRKKPTRAISLGGAPLTTMPAAPLRSPAG